MKKNLVCTLVLIVLMPLLFVCDLVFGSVSIPFRAFVDVVLGNPTNPMWETIILQLRMPKAIAAVLVGIALPVAGLLMQTLFRNPLADPYILGVSTGASLGVALFTLAGGISALSLFGSNLGIATSALVGAFAVILIICALATKVRDTASLLIVGVMFGSAASAVVSVLQYFSNPDELHSFVLWTMGSLANIGRPELTIMAGCILPVAAATFLLHRQLDVLLLGENYAFSLGVKIRQTRLCVIAISAVLAGIVTAFAGPIGFVGMTVPHIARFVFRTSQHKKLLGSSILIGINLMLLCDILSQALGTTLPINTITAIFGAPIVIVVICSGRR